MSNTKHRGTDATAPSLDGRYFRSIDSSDAGEVGPETTFAYRQDGDCVWAEYQGGHVRLGFLVGTRQGDQLDFRYSQLNNRGDTANGHCQSEIVTRDDGLIELHERWEWESQSGQGSSIVREVLPE